MDFRIACVDRVALLSAASRPARAGEEEVKRAENAVRVLKES
jgi:hypothetical protein